MTLRKRLLDGTFYDVLTHPFHEERGPGDKPIPMIERAPSVRLGTNVIRNVVEDVTFLLFGERQFPVIDTADPVARKVFADLIEETNLSALMRDVAFWGATGSQAVRIHLSKTGRVHFTRMDTHDLTPIWNDDDPDVLDQVIQKRKVTGRALKSLGYRVADDDLNANFWFQRIWDDMAEWWFVPWKCADDTDETPHTPEIDAKRSVEHKLGMQPLEWVKTYHGGDDIDGGCFFFPVVDDAIQIDYQMSQVGRGLKYNADPLLLIKEPPVAPEFGTNGLELTVDPSGNISLHKSPSSILSVNSDKNGGAEFVEMKGTGFSTQMEYVEKLKSAMIEAIHGNRISDPSKISGGARGAKALEMVNQGLIMLADTLRDAYGERLLRNLLKKFVTLVAKRPGVVKVMGEAVPAQVGKVKDINPRWADWYAPTPQDLLTQAQAFQTLIKTGVISRETAIKAIAADYDIDSADVEKALIAAEQKAEDERMMTLAAAQAKTSAVLRGDID